MMLGMAKYKPADVSHFASARSLLNGPGPVHLGRSCPLETYKFTIQRSCRFHNVSASDICSKMVRATDGFS